MNEREHLSLAASVLLLPLVHFFTALFYRRQSTAVFFPVIGILPFVSRELQVGDWFVSDCAHHHPVFANRAFPARRQIVRFCGDFRPLISRIFVSVSAHPFWRRYLGACLRIQKFRSRRPGSGTNPTGLAAVIARSAPRDFRALGSSRQLFHPAAVSPK